MTGTFKQLFKHAIPSPRGIVSAAFEAFRERPREDDGTSLRLGGGPVARIPRGTYERRCTPWEPDPARPDTHLRCFHYTKGWRYRRDLDALVS